MAYDEFVDEVILADAAFSAAAAAVAAASAQTSLESYGVDIELVGLHLDNIKWPTLT